MKIFKIICYTIEFIVLLALAWHWIKQCATNQPPADVEEEVKK